MAIGKTEGSAADLHVPIVCRSCSRVQYVALARLRSASALACSGCASRLDLGAIQATIPPRILRVDGGEDSSGRPLSEFP